MYDRSKCEITSITEFISDDKVVKGILPTYNDCASAAANVYIPKDICVYPGTYTYVDLLLCADLEIGYCLSMIPSNELFINYGILAITNVIDSTNTKNIHVILYNITNNIVSIPANTCVAYLLLQECFMRATKNTGVNNDK